LGSFCTKTFATPWRFVTFWPFFGYRPNKMSGGMILFSDQKSDIKVNIALNAWDE
jgi:hypothetical protein